MNVKLKRLDDNAIVPMYSTPGSAGCDLCSIESAVIKSGNIKIIRTGLAIQLPKGFEAQIRPRSGLAAKFSVTVLNSPGTIDSDYRGEIKVILINHSRGPFIVEKGSRIAQLVVAPVIQCVFDISETLDDSKRGENGFGSTDN